MSQFFGGRILKIYERKVNYYETDQMGIVHHSNYIRYFEEARVSFMEQAGYPYERLEREDIVSPVIGITCKYLQPVKFGDRIRIEVRLIRMTKLKCTFSYEISDAETGEIRARGTSEHGFITREGKPVVIPRDKPEFHDAFLAQLEPEE